MQKGNIKVNRIVTTIDCTLEEDQPLRLLLNLLFYHFNCSEPTYKPQYITAPRCNCRVQSIILECSELDVVNGLFLQPLERSQRSCLIETKFPVTGNQCFLCNALKQHFSHDSLETDYNAVNVINYTILVQPIPPRKTQLYD